MASDSEFAPVDYPDDVLTDLIDDAIDRFETKIDEHGPGKNWVDDDPEYHLWRAQVNLSKGGDGPGINHDELADAINHIAFAAEIDAERRHQ